MIEKRKKYYFFHFLPFFLSKKTKKSIDFLKDSASKSSSNISEITDDTQMTMFTADGLIKSLLKKLNLDEIFRPKFFELIKTRKKHTQ